MGAAAFRSAAIALICSACTTIAVDARTFEGTTWHITSINGRATPEAGDYHVEFKAGRIGGRFGCNAWGGHYSVTGEALTAQEVIATQVACDDAAMTVEKQGLAVINQPMRWSWISGQKMKLSNAAGSMELDRLSP